MARFDVYANPGSQAATTPYLLDVQSDLLNGLESRMVIPLRSLKHFPKVKLSTRLTPIFTIEGKEYLLETP
jgi:toxin CcdB